MIIEKIPIDKIKPAKYNPRKDLKPGDPEYEQLKKSIATWGYVDTLVWNKRSGNLISGHQRLKILKENGLKGVEVSVVDLDDGNEKALNVALNKISGDWNPDMLLPLLDEIKLAGIDVELTGFTAADISLLGKKDVEEDDFDAGAAADAIKEPVTKPGDIWILGRHKLLCGDSCKKEDVKRLIDNQKINLIFNDPPYGISAVGGGGVTHFKGAVGGGGGAVKAGKNKMVNAKIYSQVIGDDTTETAKKSYQLCKELGIKNIIVWGGNYFTDFLPPSRCWIIWDKENTGNFADVEIAWTSFGTGARLYRWLWNGLSRKGERKAELASRVHPTQKPVGLFGNILNDFSKDKEIIVDLFGGSGSTLIACEQLDRACYMCEIDPIYCDVIVQRFEAFTKTKAHLQEGSP